MVRTEPTADASLAAIFERSRFGIAMAAMIRMIATTISNSISEKPFCFLFIVSPRSKAPKSLISYVPGWGTYGYIARERPVRALEALLLGHSVKSHIILGIHGLHRALAHGGADRD